MNDVINNDKVISSMYNQMADIIVDNKKRMVY